jgi:uncharacterized LabA/DUF88 family protein
MHLRKTAVLVDGGFFTKRHRKLFGESTAVRIIKDIQNYSVRHCLKAKTELYRIFYYDCPPLTKRVHHPASGVCIDLSKTERAIKQQELLTLLKKTRKVALRLGSLSDNDWSLKPNHFQDLLKRKVKLEDIDDAGYIYGASQKGVDMKIGLDIASLAYKKQVSQIVLISGDSDFVPAAKLARREGLEFILDPLWGYIDESLHEHIDGLHTFAKRPDRR